MDATAYQRMKSNYDTHWWARGRREILSEVLTRWITEAGNSRILEIGAGTGANISLLSRFGTVTAVEMDDDARAIMAQDHPGLAIRSGALPDPEMFNGETFDAAVMFDVLEHVAEEAEALKVIRSHISPGGHLFISVPAYQWLWGHHDERVHHHRRYSRGRLRSALETAGWKVEQVGYFNTFLFPLAVAARMKDRISGRVESSTGSAIPPGPVNEAFYRIFRTERHRVANGGYPFGLSVVAVATNAASGES